MLLIFQLLLLLLVLVLPLDQLLQHLERVGTVPPAPAHEARGAELLVLGGIVVDADGSAGDRSDQSDQILWW